MILSGRVNKWERYNGPHTDEIRPLVDVMVHNASPYTSTWHGCATGPTANPRESQLILDLVGVLWVEVTRIPLVALRTIKGRHPRPRAAERCPDPKGSPLGDLM